jgi:hypothetical protein
MTKGANCCTRPELAALTKTRYKNFLKTDHAENATMPRGGSVTFGDLIGQLDTLRVTCDECGRAGHYRVANLVAGHGPDGRLTDWLHALTEDCPRKNAPGLSDPCGARMPDLLKLGAAATRTALTRRTSRKA